MMIFLYKKKSSFSKINLKHSRYLLWQTLWNKLNAIYKKKKKDAKINMTFMYDLHTLYGVKIKTVLEFMSK